MVHETCNSTRRLVGVTRLSKGELWMLESHRDSADKTPDPSGLNSTTWSCCSGRVTRGRDDGSCTRPFASRRRILPTLILTTSVHGSCRPEFDVIVSTRRRCKP